MLLHCLHLSRGIAGQKWRKNEVRRGNYLPWGFLTKIVDSKNEIRKHISATMTVPKKLDIFWLRANCNKKWKLFVYNSVTARKLLYGLESLEPTDATGKLLNTFQLKGLRKILQLHTSFIQGQNTNGYVYRRALRS